MEQPNKIYMQSWLDLHEHKNSTEADRWYLELAHQLLEVIGSSKIYETLPAGNKKQIALLLALYLEDVICESGGWWRFRELHQKYYGKTLPFYDLTDSYLKDEVNVEDIKFLMWCFNSGTLEDGSYATASPHDTEFTTLGEVLYELYYKVFEDAPISEGDSLDWVLDREILRKKRDKLPATAPVDDSFVKESATLLANNSGAPLRFFSSYLDLALCFKKELNWGSDKEPALPELAVHKNFILFANAKGVLVAPDIAQWFKHEDNPLYDAESAKKRGYALFCEQGACPFDLLRYGMSIGAFEDIALPFEGGKNVLAEEWDFIARWYLRVF